MGSICSAKLYLEARFLARKIDKEKYIVPTSLNLISSWNCQNRFDGIFLTDLISEVTLNANEENWGKTNSYYVIGITLMVGI